MKQLAALMTSIAFTASILLLGLTAAGKLADFAPDLAMPDTRGLMQGGLAREFESIYDERFPAKTFGTNLWAAIAYGIFGEGRSGVVVGEGGWLFTDEEFKTYPAARASLDANLGYIRLVSQHLRRRNSTLVIVPVPSKRRLYPEFAGTYPVSSVHAEAQERLAGMLDRAGIPRVDLFAALEACKASHRVFLRADTHWTPEGARCAAEAVGVTVRHIGQGSPDSGGRYEMPGDMLREHRGDLMQFLPLDPYFSQFQLPPELIQVARAERTGAPEATAEQLLGESTMPQVVLIGTSYSADTRWNFAGALQGVLREEVLNRSGAGQGPLLPMQKYLAEAVAAATAAPRLVIWEMPERMLPVAYALAPQPGI